MKIKKISKIDIGQCAKILKSAYAEEPYNENFLEGNELKYIEEKYRSCSSNSFVATDNSEIHGFIFWSISCWSNGPQAILEEIVIAKEHQGKGLGQDLVDYSHKYLRDKGVKSIMLWAINDPKIIGFHKKNGYSIANEHCVMFKDIED